MIIINNRFECSYLELFKYNTLRNKSVKYDIKSVDIHKHILLHNKLKQVITCNTVVLCDEKLDYEYFNEIKLNLPSVTSGDESIEYTLKYKNLYNLDLKNYDEYLSMRGFLQSIGCRIGNDCMVLTTLKPPLT